MPDSPTGNEALHGGVAEDDKDLPGAAVENNVEGNTEGATTVESPATEPKDDNKPKDIVDAVRAALSDGKEQSSGSGEGEGEESDPSKKPAEGDKPKEGEEDDLGELTEEELKSYKPRTRRRFEKLDRENKTLSSKVTELEPQAQGFRAIQEFSRTANLNREDINTGFEVMRLMRNDPVRAYEVLTPIYQQLQALVGEVLPKDLHDQVVAGQITQAAAKELSRLRAERGVNTNVQREQQQREEQQRTEEGAQQVRQLQHGVAGAITKWEADWKASDPDYSLKQSRVNEAIELELTRNVILANQGKPNKLPRTVEEAVKLANDVKKRVEKEMRAFVPKKNTAITHVHGNGVTNGSTPAPRNLREAIGLAVGQK